MRLSRIVYRRRKTVRRFLASVTLLALTSATLAHTPHHVIDDLELSPGYSNDSTLFVLVHNYLLRSKDRAGSWTPLGTGIDTPFILTDVELSGRFESDGTLFVASGGSGVFKSTDRGDTWNRFNTALTQLDIGKLLLVEGSGEPILVAAGSSRGLFGSFSTQAEWVRLLSDDVQITALGYTNDDGKTTVFAGDSQGGIWRSGPDIDSWQRVTRLDDAGAVTAFAQLRGAGDRTALIVGTENSGLLHLSADGAIAEYLPQGWKDATIDCDRLSNPTIRDIEVSSDGSRVFFSTWSNALYAVNDDGKSIEVLDNGLRCDVQADHQSFQTPHFRNIEFSGDNSDWFLATFDGLFRSVDQGKTWVSLETMPVNLIRGLSISAATGQQHQLLVTTYGGGAYLTSDLGETWTIMNHGLHTTRLADAAFSANPTDSGQIYALARGRLLSAPRPGAPWDSKNLNELSWLEQINAQIFGSVRRSNVWPMHIELSPSFARDQTLMLGFRRAGIWISEDAGESWDSEWVGPTDYVTDMQISPNFANDRTAFAAFRGAGIYVTRDGGTMWRPSNNGFGYFANHKKPKSPNHLVDPPLSRAITDAVLAVSPDYANDQTVFAGSAAGLFRSTHGGGRWQQLDIVEDGQFTSITGLAVSPNFASDQTVVVGVKGRGLYRSTDGGSSFEAAGRPSAAVSFEPRFIAFSPSYKSDNVIYAATDWSLWLSKDSGDSWARVTRPTRYEDSRGPYSGPVWFSGEWTRESGATYSASTQTTAEQAGATATLNFTGESISWYGEQGPTGGTARVSIDGREVGIVDLSAERVADDVVVFSTDYLDFGMHEIEVEVLRGRVTIDSFDIGQ